MAKKTFLFVIISLLSILITTGFRVDSIDATAPLNDSFYHTNGMEIGYLSTDNRNEAGHLFMDTWGFTMEESLPICGIAEYFTDGDDDMSWSCTISVGNGGWKFDLFEANDGNSGSSGYVSANALVLDKNYFELLDGAEFWIFSDYVQVKRFDSDFTWKKFAPDQYESFYIPPGAIPLVTINTYDTNGDDDFSFKTYFDWPSSSLVLDGENGNENSYAYGVIYILRGRTHPKLGSDYVGKIEDNGWFFNGNANNNVGDMVDFNFNNGFWNDANTFAFNSVFSIWSSDKDYQFSTSNRVRNDGVTAYVWRDLGDENSQMGLQVAVLQTYPLN